MEHNQTNADGINVQSPSSVARVMKTALDNGLRLELSEYPTGTRTAQQAASAVGCAVDQIVKSMVFEADREILLALTSGCHQVDPKTLAQLADVEKCDRADVDRVREVTGFAIGGVAPFGHKNPIRCWIDPHLITFNRVWAAAGTPRHVFGIDPQQLVDITGAIVADFTVTRNKP